MEKIKNKAVRGNRVKKSNRNRKYFTLKVKLWPTLESLQRRVGRKIDSAKLVRQQRD